ALQYVESILCGYRGLLKFGSSIADALENQNFTKKLSEKKPLKLKESWYDKDPFAYIESGSVSAR
ncbi:MAG: hypothetical protein LBN43_08595, partial [Oscillospiraceae bacterium]|nr:hypothetical protein [Oscillospiraceae bacterium]